MAIQNRLRGASRRRRDTRAGTTRDLLVARPRAARGRGCRGGATRARAAAFANGRVRPRAGVRCGGARRARRRTRPGARRRRPRAPVRSARRPGPARGSGLTDEPRLAAIPAPQLHLPAERPEDNRRYLLWSTDGFPATVNGRSSLDPIFTQELIAHVRGFPNRSSVELLRALGVRSVVIYERRVDGTPWERAGGRSIRGLPVTRERRGDVVVYELRSPTPPSTGAPTAIAGDVRSARRSR